MRYFFYSISSILLLLISGCSTGVHQSAPAKKTKPFEQIAFKTLNKEEVDQKLRKLHNVKEESYEIVTGDRFDIYVYDNPDLTVKSLIVMPDGTISLGLIGVVPIAGKTIKDATDLINKRFSKYIVDPKTTLVPTHIQSSIFTIAGSVINPGVYSIKSGYKISDAIAAAQGFAQGVKDGDSIELANLDNAFIARGEKVLPVDFNEIIKKGNQLYNIPVINGDYIYIPSSMNQEVYVLGEVVSPGYYAFTENFTLLRALSWSQGRLNTSSDYAVIVRGGLLNPNVYKVNVEDVLRGRAPDFKLMPNDIVYFPSGAFTDYNLVIEKIIPTFELLAIISGPIKNLAPF